jgi:hypothetical protein
VLDGMLVWKHQSSMLHSEIILASDTEKIINANI